MAKAGGKFGRDKRKKAWKALMQGSTLPDPQQKEKR